MANADIIVHARGLAKHYDTFTAVAGIDFSVARGECFGLLGPNGAGKTTTLRMLMGATPPSHGTLEVLGYSIPAHARAMRARLGVVPQQDNLDPDFSVLENLLSYGSYFGLQGAMLRKRAHELLEFAQLTTRAQAKISALSGGMKRRLTLARALINDPDILILDEPTTGLDPQARQVLWARLRELLNQGKTLLLTTHYMDEAERLCHRLIVLDQGKILVEGSPQALMDTHIEPHVVEVHGPTAPTWFAEQGYACCVRGEQVGETIFCYAYAEQPLLASLRAAPTLRFLHRRANLEDVFLKLTGKELREN